MKRESDFSSHSHSRLLVKALFQRKPDFLFEGSRAVSEHVRKAKITTLRTDDMEMLS